MEHSDKLENASEEDEVAVALAGVLFSLVLLEMGVTWGHFAGFFFRDLLGLHISVIADPKHFSTGGLNRVGVHCSCKHVVKVRHCRQGRVTNNDQAVAVQRVQENNRHQFQRHSDGVLDETKKEGVGDSGVLSILSAG